MLKLKGQEITLKDQTNNVTATLKIPEISIVEIKRQTLLDLLEQGLQLNLVVAVDFTASNGIPTDPSSLHYFSSKKLNQYEICINTIGTILCPCTLR